MEEGIAPFNELLDKSLYLIQLKNKSYVNTLTKPELIKLHKETRDKFKAL